MATKTKNNGPCWTTWGSTAVSFLSLWPLGKKMRQYWPDGQGREHVCPPFSGNIQAMNCDVMAMSSKKEIE